MQSTIAPLLEQFSARPVAVKDELRTYAECDPDGFLKEVLPVVRSNGDPQARLYLVHLLLKSRLLVEYLVDASQSVLEDAVAVAKTIRDLGVPIVSGLENAFIASLKDKSAGAIVIRLMELSRALSLDKLIMQFQDELMAHTDTKVRSKAALEIGLASKNPAWVVRMLLHGDPRVQANAVESLWDSADHNVRSVLMIGARSPHGRVAANGLYGLYRQGALESVTQLLKMAADADPDRRASALWAIGETRDPRFLPWLTRAYEKAEGKEKQRVLRAMSRVRQQVRAYAVAGDIRMTVVESAILPDKSRRIAVAMWSRNGDLSSLSPSQFALWENNELVTGYTARCVASPPLLIVGLALPRFDSEADPYAQAVERALTACVELKRAADPWCAVRYLTDDDSRAAAARHAPMLGRDVQSALSTHMKNHRGFVLDPELMQQVILDPGQREVAAKDFAACVDRLVDITDRVSGPRHLFVFFTAESAAEEPIRRLARSLRSEAVTLHGFAAEGQVECAPLQDLCGQRNGTFQAVPVEHLPKAVTETYLALLSRYEILYTAPSDPGEAALCDVRISSPQGCGQVNVPFPPGH
jgi:hypothetical protein